MKIFNDGKLDVLKNTFILIYIKEIQIRNHDYLFLNFNCASLFSLRKFQQIFTDNHFSSNVIYIFIIILLANNISKRYLIDVLYSFFNNEGSL